MVGDSLNDKVNPELFLPKKELKGGRREKQIALPKVQSADPILLGGSLRHGKIKTQLFTPLVDGYIIPIQQLSRISGKPALDIMSMAQEIIGSGTKDRGTEILNRLGIEGRAFGGPVKADIPVVVGEPLPGSRVNPEIFLPSIKTISGIKEILREAGSGFLKPGGKVRRIGDLPFPTLPPGPTRLPTQTTGGTGPTRLPTQTTGGTTASKGLYDPILDRGLPSDDSFQSASTVLRQMYFSPPFVSGGRGGNTYDNRKTVEVISPDVNTGLSQIEIAQIKELYAQLRLEETLV